MKNQLAYCYLLLILIATISCQSNVPPTEECSKFMHEECLNEKLDSALINSAIEYRTDLINRFGETSIKGLAYNAYHFQSFSAHGFGQSIKFEKNESGCFLSKKCITKLDWLPDCENYQMKISEEEWIQLEAMIYDFNFWTVQQFKERRGVLDGFVYFLEGNRPEAKKCNKKAYRLIGRSSPNYDKMGALCQYIGEYEQQLLFKYE